MQILKSTKTKNNNTVSLLKSNISGEKNVLIIGGFHGDEPQGPALIDAYLENFDNGKNTVFVVPCLNPDGIAVNTRRNASKVDLNRNFPTEDFDVTADSQYFGGISPASEPETKFLVEILDEYRFDLILTLHAPYETVNFDGPAEKIAENISALTSYPVQPDIGYPTPGSFGTYAGVERKIPVITLELSETEAFPALKNRVFPVFDYCVNIF